LDTIHYRELWVEHTLVLPVEWEVELDRVNHIQVRFKLLQLKWKL
jgi:hypothetical protein